MSVKISMNRNLWGAVADGGKSVVGGILAMWGGMVWGNAISWGGTFWKLSLADWLLGWLMNLLPSVFVWEWMETGEREWWFLFPLSLWVVLPVMAYGALGRRWNRWMVAGALAFVSGTSGLCLVTWFHDARASLPWLRLLPPAILFAFGLARTLFLRYHKP